MNALVSRRALLGAVPTLAAPMALLPASISAAGAETPILSLYRQWAPIRASVVDPAIPNDLSDAHMAALYPPLLALESRIEAEPVTSLEHLAAKVSALATDEGDGFAVIPQSVVEESRTLLGEVTPLQVPARPADPLPGLLTERARLAEEWQAAGRLYGEGSPEDHAAWDAFMAAEKAIETAVATTPEGLLAQFAYIRVSYCSGSPEQGWPALTDELPLAFLDVIAEGVRRIGQ